MVARVYVPDVPADAARVEVRGDEAHHLTRVVRARAGDGVRVIDGRGHEWHARVAEVGRQSVVLTLEQPMTPVAEPPVHVTLGIGVLKGDQMDTVVRDATVLGVSRIVPLSTDHVAVPSRAWRADAAGARWRRVGVAAAKQCGRAVVPEVAPVMGFEELWASSRAEMALACVEPGAALARASDWRTLARPASALLLVGPEGGWSTAEVAALMDRQAHPVRLGPRTLRAESVPTVAMAVLWTTWGW